MLLSTVALFFDISYFFLIATFCNYQFFKIHFALCDKRRKQETREKKERIKERKSNRCQKKVEKRERERVSE